MEKPTYEQALAELQQLIDELQEQNVSLDHLQASIRRARELVDYCRTKLRQAESESYTLLEGDSDQKASS
jgi:exodeoxyribonuclease VII small subunit